MVTETECSFLRYLDTIERAVANGDCVLIENMGENMDPVLDALVGRNTIKKGRFVIFVVCSLVFVTCTALQYTSGVHFQKRYQ